MNAQDSSDENKRELQRLRKSVVQIEEMMQVKNNQVANCIKSAMKSLDMLNILFEGSQSIRYLKFRAPIEYY